MLEKFQQFMYKEDKFKMFDDYDIAVLLASNREPGDGLIGMLQLSIKYSNQHRKIFKLMHNLSRLGTSRWSLLY